YHIVEALVRWLAPILSFTADEIWQHIPGGRRHEFVFLDSWYEGLFPMESAGGLDQGFWETMLSVRELVGKTLEPLRASGDIGSSLDAEVELYCDLELLELLVQLEDELRFVLITSYARVHPLADTPVDLTEQKLPGGYRMAVAASSSSHGKCIRCWHHREEVGSHSEHPKLCGRCVENVTGQGEQRRYA
ncbi:MAG: class I tRNA ligase family protein, partial [Gammaproteobacteria bacterium]|nr:class I tRNA ligase family protein [Gammaproteobacteria bacterium]